MPFVIDLGSGNLSDFGNYGLPDEPTVRQVLQDGVDLVTFSGDKLLGGPQCGIIAGNKEIIGKVKSNPLKRALRVDKMTLAALVEVLRLYQNPAQLKNKLPTLAHLTRSVDDIHEQTLRIEADLANAIPGSFTVSTVTCTSQVGSGSLPMAGIPSYGLAISVSGDSSYSITQLVDAMRGLARPVIGRMSKGAYLLDLRCLDDETEFVKQLKDLHGVLS